MQNQAFGETIAAQKKRVGETVHQIDARMAVLVETGQLEAAGSIKRWRYSEVRLPGAPVAAGE